jgi:hypothetical protein
MSYWKASAGAELSRLAQKAGDEWSNLAGVYPLNQGHHIQEMEAMVNHR